MPRLSTPRILPAEQLLAANGVEHRRLDREGLSAAYPQIVFRDGESGFVETNSGALILKFSTPTG